MWELCKRKTKCQTCGKTMRKGERRHKSVTRGRRFANIVYRCTVCMPTERLCHFCSSTFLSVHALETHVRIYHPIIGSSPTFSQEISEDSNGGSSPAFSQEISEDSKLRFLGRMLRPILPKKGE
jgi:hypothetical protein